MKNNFLSVAHVNKNDIGGGAARVAWDLFNGLRAQGHKQVFIVSEKKTNDEDVYQIPLSCWEALNFYCEKMVAPISRIKGGWRLKEFFHHLARPKNYFDYKQGHEEFSFAGSSRFFKKLPQRVDIIHAHNLHYNYFDLGLLPDLSNRVPFLVTLHDMWWLSGHCVHAFECERWQTGCGSCPHLNFYPYKPKDATMYNWKKKAAIYAQSKLFIVAPSKWIMDKVEKSLLVPGIIDSKIIPLGVDLNVFKPAKKSFVRALLNIPEEEVVFLFIAERAQSNPWKNFGLFKIFIEKMGGIFPMRKILGICLGDTGQTLQWGNAKITFAGYVYDQVRVAQYFQAADVCVHLTKAETCPLVTIEALACGTPVIASCVGGVSELIKDVDNDSSCATGFCIENENIDKILMAGKILIDDVCLRERLSHNAVLEAKKRFNLVSQISSYLDWYYYVIDKHKKIIR